MLKPILTLSGVLFPSLLCMGWGQKGHDVTAYIAEQHLNETTKTAIDSLLDGKSIVYWANWLDNASHTPQYNYSKTWHYKNIDDDQTYESAPDHQAGNIVTALRRNINIIKDARTTKEDKALALKMIVHLFGDLHQPMHMGHQTDLGGNKVMVKYFDAQTNLHSVWDSRVPEAAHKWSYTEWQQQIDRASEAETSDIQKGNIDDWAKETYVICKEVYEKTPKGYNVSYDYIADWTPTIEQQFLKGGLRLAYVLNSLFSTDTNYNAEF
jgi:hypothetical protein